MTAILRRRRKTGEVVSNALRDQAATGAIREAMAALNETADPSSLIAYLREGQPIDRRVAHEIADLFDPQATRHRVIAKISFRTRGAQKKLRQQAEIYNAAVFLRGGSRNNKMPNGGWDAISAHFNLDRKSVQRAYENQCVVVDDELAQLLEGKEYPDSQFKELYALLRKCRIATLSPESCTIEEETKLLEQVCDVIRAAGIDVPDLEEKYHRFEARVRAAQISAGDDNAPPEDSDL